MQLALPATFAETDALTPLAYACQRLEELRDKHIPGVGPVLHRNAGEIFARKVIQLRAMSDAAGMKAMIDLARVYDEAEGALRDLAQELMNRNQCPVLLKAYAIEILPKPYQRKKGRRKSKNLVQDLMFASLVADLVHKFGMHPTRRTYAEHNSACDILVMSATV
jgi:hypothetical protein